MTSISGVGVVILRIIYGYPARSATDRLLENAMEMMEIFNKTAQPGNFLVDAMPSRKLESIHCTSASLEFFVCS